MPAARQPEVPANDHSPVAKRAGAVGRRSRPKKALAGLATAILLAAGGWYGYPLADHRPLHRLDRRRLCARRRDHARRQGLRLRRQRSTSTDNAHVHAGDVIARSTTATTGLRSTPRATRSPRSRRPSSGSASRSTRSRPRSSRPRRNSPRPRPPRPAPSSSSSASRTWRAQDFASRQTLEQAQANRDQAVGRGAARASRASMRRRPTSRCSRRSRRRRRARSQQLQDRARQGRARSVLHRHSRAVRRRGRQPRHAGRRLRAAGAAARQPGAAGRRLHRRQLQGDAAGAAQAGQTGVDHASTRCPAATIDGTVASVAPASGSVFSLLPPDNATGNFTKIVQRLAGAHPACRPTSPSRRVLRPGMSVVVDVNTKREPPPPPTARGPTPATRRALAAASGEVSSMAIANATAAASASPPGPVGAAPERDRIEPRRLFAFLAMVLRHVHGDPRHPDRLGFADRDPGRASPASADEIPWVQTAYLIAEVVADPALRLPVARDRHAHAVRRLRRRASPRRA